MKKLAVYVRVSSVGQNVAGQRAEIQKWLDAHGYTDVEWFIDKMTGRRIDRPEFDRLQAAIFSGEVGSVVVWKLDRLSRTAWEGCKVLSEWCHRDIRVVSVTQQLDLTGALGRVVATLLLGIAEMEWENGRERQAAGIAVAKANGVYTGRKRGSTKAKPQRAADLRRRGLNDTEIATALGVSRRTVQRYLRSAAN